MVNRSVLALAACALASVASPVLAQHQMPAGSSHEEHLKQLQKDNELKRRGALAMGFDQDATRHEFRTLENGGTIEVSVKDAGDATNLAAIRSHLKEIAASFAAGDFSKPFQTHAENPPGVETMKALEDSISYTFEETPRGGRVRIHTADGDALRAVHQFLEYQIKEHHTAH